MIPPKSSDPLYLENPVAACLYEKEDQMHPNLQWMHHLRFRIGRFGNTCNTYYPCLERDRKEYTTNDCSPSATLEWGSSSLMRNI